MVRFDQDGNVIRGEGEDSIILPKPTEEEIECRALQAEAERTGLLWWDLWLAKKASLGMHLAAASASHARHLQAFYQNHGSREFTPDYDDIEGRKKFIISRLEMWPNELEQHWPEIQRWLLLEFQNGPSKFPRSIERAIKKGIAANEEVRSALMRGDRLAFDSAWRAYENPGFRGYADESDRYLVANWSRSVGVDWPAFCTWTNEALCFHFNEKFDGFIFNRHTFDDRISALELFKCPVKLVRVDYVKRSTSEDREPSPCILSAPHPVPGKDRLKEALRAITPDLFTSAFQQKDYQLKIAGALLLANQEIGGLSDEMGSFLKRLLEDRYAAFVVQRIPNAKG